MRAMHTNLHGLCKVAGERNFQSHHEAHGGHEGRKRFLITFFSYLRDLRVLRGVIVLRVVLATLLWLTGCMVGPDYQRPSFEIPAQFRAATTSDSASIADLKWFEVFRDERLQELIRTALS